MCSHCGWLLLKCSTVVIGFNGAETNCGIAHILGILLMNSYNTDIFLATTIICSLSTLNLLHSFSHPEHVKNAIPFLVATTPPLTTNARKCAIFLKKGGYPDSAVAKGKHRAQEIDRDYTTNVTERRNQQNSFHPHQPSTKPCSQVCHSLKLQNSPQWSRH